MLCGVVLVAGAQESAETGVSLAGGKLRIADLGGLERLASDREAMRVSFRADGGKLLAALELAPAGAGASTPAARKKRLDELLEQLREEGRRLGAEVLVPAAVVDDPALHLRVEHTLRIDGRTLERVKAVRLVGGWSATLTATAEDTSGETRDRLLARACETLLGKIEPSAPAAASAPRPSATATRPAVTVLKRAGLRFSIPAGYVARVEDLPEGVVAYLTHPDRPLRRITLTAVRIVPATGGAGAGVSDELVLSACDRAIELETPRLGLGEPVGEFETVVDSRYVRRQRRTGGGTATGGGGGGWVSDTRQLRLGLVVVSVAMACPAPDETPTARDADSLADSVRPERR